MSNPTPALADFIEAHGFQLPRVISKVVPTHAAPDRLVIGNLVQRGEITVISAAPKAGKSSFMRHAVCAMQRGWDEPWGEDIGSIIKGTALILSEEPESIWDEWREVMSIADHVSILSRQDVRGGKWPDICWYLAALAEAYKFDLVVVDTFSHFAQMDDENSATEMTAALIASRDITEAGAALWLIHHLRKAKGAGGAQARGSTALYANCETPIEMRRYNAKDKGGPRHRSFRTYSRHGYVPERFILELDDGQYRRVGKVSETATLRRQQIIVALLPDAAPGLEWAEIRAAWPTTEPKPSQRSVQRALKAAEDAGLIDSDGRTPGDKIRRRYWLSQSASYMGSPSADIVPEKTAVRAPRTMKERENSKSRQTDIVTQSHLRTMSAPVGAVGGSRIPNGQDGLAAMTAAMRGAA